MRNTWLVVERGIENKSTHTTCCHCNTPQYPTIPHTYDATNQQETPFTLWDALTNDPEMSAHSRMWAHLPCRTPTTLALNMRANLTMFFSKPLALMAAPQWDTVPGTSEQHALRQFLASTTDQGGCFVSSNTCTCWLYMMLVVIPYMYMLGAMSRHTAHLHPAITSPSPPTQQHAQNNSALHMPMQLDHQHEQTPSMISLPVHMHLHMCSTQSSRDPTSHLHSWWQRGRSTACLAS